MSFKSWKLEFIPNDEVRFIDTPIETDIFSASNEQYFVWKLKTPIEVSSSMKPFSSPVKVDELYLRQSALDRDDWEGNEVDGFYIPNWIADFSENMAVALYQEKSIRDWFNAKPEVIERKRLLRGARRSQQITDMNQRIREQMRKKSDGNK